MISWINHKYYSGLLTTAQGILDGRPSRNELDKLILGKISVPQEDGTRLVLDGRDHFVNLLNGYCVIDPSQSCLNNTEAKLIADLIDQHLKLGVPAEKIGVAALYNAQVFELRKEFAKVNKPILKSSSLILLTIKQLQIKGIKVATVDALLGSEFPICIVSTARSCDVNGWYPGLGLIRDKKRLNVALTRCQTHRTVVGTYDFFKFHQDSDILDFIEYMDYNNKYFDAFVPGCPPRPAHPRTAPPAAGRKLRDIYTQGTVPMDFLDM